MKIKCSFVESKITISNLIFMILRVSEYNRQGVGYPTHDRDSEPARVLYPVRHQEVT